VRVVGIDIERCRPRALLVAREADTHRRGRIARQRDGRDLAEVLPRLEPGHQFVRHQRRHLARRDLHDTAIQIVADLVLEAHDRAGQRDQGQQQRKHEARDRVNLVQSGLDVMPHPTHRSQPS
jgi:hypothetical protein